MKNLISSTIASLVMVAISFNSSAQTAEVQTGAKISFLEEVHDYGEVKYDGNGVCTFVFENTGNESLILGNVKGSCSCTVPEWTKAPIAPGEKGEIKVKYNTKKVGAINKSVTINSNAVNAPVKIVRIKGSVLSEPVSGVPINSSGAPVK